MQQKKQLSRGQSTFSAEASPEAGPVESHAHPEGQDHGPSPRQGHGGSGRPQRRTAEAKEHVVELCPGQGQEKHDQNVHQDRRSGPKAVQERQGEDAFSTFAEKLHQEIKNRLEAARADRESQ